MSLRDHTDGKKYLFNARMSQAKVPMFNARMNQAIGHGCNWNDGDVPYSELETALHHEVSSPVAIYSFGPQKTNFISGLIDWTVIDITQLGCPELADISLPAITSTRDSQMKHFTF
jgi:hypothetical protein